MLDQFNKETSPQDYEHLPEEAPLSKKKIAFALSGATFALVFILFLMGLFRSEDTPQAARSPTSKKNTLVALDDLEDKISVLQKRLDLIEEEHAKFVMHTGLTTKDIIASVAQDPNPEPPVIPPASPFPQQDAISMTNQAIMNVVTKNATPNDSVAPDTTSTQTESTTPTNGQPAPVIKKRAPSHPRNRDAEVPSDNNAKQPEYDVTKPFKYTVKQGDTLSKISKKFYGTPNRWQSLYEANRGSIQNMDNLKVGTVLTIPPKHLQQQKQQ